MAKKKQIRSISLEDSVQEKLVLAAKQRTDDNVSKLIAELVEKYIVLDDSVVPIVLKVPLHIKDNPKELEKWVKIALKTELENC